MTVTTATLGQSQLLDCYCHNYPTVTVTPTIHYHVTGLLSLLPPRLRDGQGRAQPSLGLLLLLPHPRALPRPVRALAPPLLPPLLQPGGTGPATGAGWGREYWCKEKGEKLR